MIDKKIKNNAISAYMWLALLFLITPSKNKNIKNSFVLNHSKTWVLIHILMFLTYYIFIPKKFLYDIEVFGYNLNNILWTSILIFLFLILLFWIYKSSKWENFLIKDLVVFWKIDKIYEIDNSKKDISEKDIITNILSLIPIVGYFLEWKNKNNLNIKNNIKINLIFSSFIAFIYLSWYKNPASIFSLLYIIFIVFLSINLIINKTSINFKLDKIPSFHLLNIYTHTLVIYLYNYFKEKKFISIKEVFDKKNKDLKEKDIKELEELNNLKSNKIPTVLYYIPIINIIWLIDIKSKYKNHIINWLLISIIFIINYIFFNFYFLIFIIFIISFAIWNLRQLNYKIPFLWDIYIVSKFVYLKVYEIYKKILKKHKDDKTVHFN